MAEGIRILAPPESVDAAGHAAMMRLASLEGLGACMRENGIRDAEIMPPYTRGTFVPDGDDFEIYVLQSDLTELREKHGDTEIGDFIGDRLDMLGGVFLPFSQYDLHKQTYKLTVVATLA